MNPLPASTAAEEAALWAARLDGSVLTAGQRTALEAWLAAHPAHRGLLSAYCQFSADLEQQLPLLEGIREETAEITAPRTAQPHPWLRWPILAGVTLTAAAAVTVALWVARPRTQFENLATPVAQRSAVTLADGTRVELNAQTALVVELTADARRVRLAGGEAFFSVSPDPARPFYVETPAGSVRVTGTQFNVRTESPAALEVTVLEGAVQVRPGDDAPRDLAARDRLVRAADHVAVTALSPRQLGETLAWREGRIVFADTPLREALARFARYHGRNLTASDAAARERVGGTHRLDDLDDFLTSIQDVLPVHVTRGPDGAIRVDAVAGR
jgi:transmembrane sensor